MNRIPDFRYFRYALSSAQHGSFRQAAAAMNVQQSTVSRSVRSLEHLVGAILFERGHGGVRPTPAGDRFLREAALGFDHLARAIQRVGALQRGERGELSVGVSVPFALLGDTFGQFRSEYPGISVEIVESTCSGGRALVQQREVDIAFLTKASAGSGQRSVHLRSERLIVAVPNSHRLAGARALTLDQLRLERFILSTGGLGPEIAECLARCLGHSGADLTIQLHEVGQCNLLDMVAKGFGVTIIVCAHPKTTSADVALVPLAARHFIQVHAVWMESNPNPALRRLLDLIPKSGRAQSVNSL